MRLLKCASIASQSVYLLHFSDAENCPPSRLRASFIFEIRIGVLTFPL